MISLDIAVENGWNLWCDELGFPEPFPPRQSPCSHTCKAYTGLGMGNIGTTHVISYLATSFSVQLTRERESSESGFSFV